MNEITLNLQQRWQTSLIAQTAAAAQQLLQWSTTFLCERVKAHQQSNDHDVVVPVLGMYPKKVSRKDTRQDKATRRATVDKAQKALPHPHFRQSNLLGNIFE